MANKLRHLKQTVSFNDWLKIFAEELKAKASRLPPGPERVAVFLRARQAEAVADLNERAAPKTNLENLMAEVVSLREKVARAESMARR